MLSTQSRSYSTCTATAMLNGVKFYINVLFFSSFVYNLLSRTSINCVCEMYMYKSD